MLTDIYSFFTGGFDRVDLLQAKALLDAWALSGGLNDRLLKDGRLAIEGVSQPVPAR
ncbi:hypothetical protein [Pseudomonas veronii]|uniref:hypothetical protein n=1 Tax=Pseudomonas veronii TaxID=76761 RepID=UPI0021ADCBA0|nr:hypothetical protein [Pseudomonas veronii]